MHVADKLFKDKDASGTCFIPNKIHKCHLISCYVICIIDLLFDT